MKKNLNTSALESQLAGSVFFKKNTNARLADQQTSQAENKQKRQSTDKQVVSHSPLRTPSSKEEESAIKANQRTVTPNERTDEPNGLPERSTLLSELEEGLRESKRGTERYSFEIFTDQKGRIEDLQYRYKKKTSRKLSSSRIIREALDDYLKKAEEAR